MAVPEFAAQAEVAPAPQDALHPPGSGGEMLLAGALRRFRARFGVADRLELRSTTTVPREVGLGGSSAIVIAALRALCAAHQVALAADEMAHMALAVEVEDCGIAAGLQDRIVQTREGLVLADCSPDGRAHELDPALLPPLYLAWLEAAAAPSGTVHAGLRERYAAGDRAVVAGLEELSDLAARAHDAVLAGDWTELARCIDGSLELRRQLMPVHPRLIEAAQLARAVGASANSAGSGGAIVGTLPAADAWPQLRGALEGAGWKTLRLG